MVSHNQNQFHFSNRKTKLLNTMLFFLLSNYEIGMKWKLEICFSKILMFAHYEKEEHDINILLCKFHKYSAEGDFYCCL